MKISIGTCLVIIFFVLKLTHVIAWGWFWVFSPWLIPIMYYVIKYFIIRLADAIFPENF